MPNWCNDRLRVRGETSEVEKFIMECFDNYEFSLSKAVPMPESLQLEESSRTNDGFSLCLYELKNKREAKKLAKLGTSNPFMDEDGYLISKEKYEEIIKRYGESIDEIRKLGLQAINNLKLYKCKTWYDWTRKNWGVKWDASDHSTLYKQRIDDKTEIVQYFLTPWGPPVEGISTLAEKYNNLEFELASYESGMDFYDFCSNFNDRISIEELEEKVDAILNKDKKEPLDDEDEEEWYGKCDAFIEAIDYYKYNRD